MGTNLFDFDARTATPVLTPEWKEKEGYTQTLAAALSPEGRYLAAIFVKETARLNKVPGGIDEDLPRVSAHEIGHALSLPHRQDTVNLMASGTTGTGLNDSEIGKAREAAQAFSWCLKPAEALALADRLTLDKQASQAAAIYRVLGALPEGDLARMAREKLAGGS